METAEHFFILPNGYKSIGLTIKISFERELLYGLSLLPIYALEQIELKKSVCTTQDKEKTKISSFARHVFIELAEYFMGQRTDFTVPLYIQGTAFQKSVWEELLKIPYGTTCAYKDIAQAIGNVKACRAVGLANNKNPINILIPCHRVIGVNGALMGYAGQVPVKAALLTLEKESVEIR